MSPALTDIVAKIDSRLKVGAVIHATYGFNTRADIALSLVLSSEIDRVDVERD